MATIKSAEAAPVRPLPQAGRRGRFAVIMVLLAAATVLVGLLSLTLGKGDYGFDTAVNAIFGDGSARGAVVITSQRLPRAVIGVVCGLAIGAAGALMQGHTRNALADPGLFGVNAGAAFAVVLVTFAMGIDSTPVRVLAALVGAGVATVLVFRGAGGLRGMTPITLALGGVAISAMLGAMTTVVVLIDRQSLNVMRFWSVGSLAGRDMSVLLWAGGIMAVGMMLALANGHALNALSLGDDTATALGKNVAAVRTVGIVTITLLAGGATAVCGPITFLGMVTPHAGRLFCGNNYRTSVPASALLGALMLLVADVLGRIAIPGQELQVGLMMAVLGAPVLIVLIRRKRLAEL